MASWDGIGLEKRGGRQVGDGAESRVELEALDRLRRGQLVRGAYEGGVGSAVRERGEVLTGGAGAHSTGGRQVDSG